MTARELLDAVEVPPAPARPVQHYAAERDAAAAFYLRCAAMGIASAPVPMTAREVRP